jgi:hypothetical protein
VEKCCFAIYVDGGPPGRFTCELQGRQGVQFIQLDGCSEQEIGVSHIEIVCSPRSLDAFGIIWRVELEGRNSSTWLPKVHPAIVTTLPERVTIFVAFSLMSTI